MKACLTIILFCFSALQPRAQEIMDAPSARLLTSFKFELLSGGIIIVRAQLDDFADTLNFILDTGSGGISLDSMTTEIFQLKRTPSERSIRGIGGVKAVEYVLGHTLKLPGLSVKDLDFHVNDYALLTSVYGIRIDGIIGFSFLRRYIVALDYDETTMSVYTPGVFKYPKGGHFLRPSFTSIPMQPAEMKDGRTLKHRYYFDTGAGLCFLLTEDFVSDSNVLAKRKIMVATQAEGLGGKRPMMLTTVKQVRIGPYKFRKVPTFVFKDEFNVTAYPSTGGLLGNDLLRRFNVVLNYPDQTIHIKPNKAFDTPFDYSYTGLAIYVENGDIVVEEVIKGSPGEQAGFQPGDKIISVGGNFSQNIQAYKTLLQGADARIKIIVMRDGSAKMLTLQVRNILKRK